MYSFSMLILGSLLLNPVQSSEQIEDPTFLWKDHVPNVNITRQESLHWLNDHKNLDAEELKRNKNLSVILSYHLRNADSNQILLGDTKQEEEVHTQKNDHNLDTQCSYESDCTDSNSYCCTESDDCEVVGQCACKDGYTDDGKGTCVGSSYKMVTTVALVTSLILISAVLIAFICYVMTYVNMRCHRRINSATDSVLGDPEDIDEPPTYSEVQSMEEKPPSYQEYVKWVTRIKERQGISNPSYSPPLYHTQMSLEASPSPSMPGASVFSIPPAMNRSGVILTPGDLILPSHRTTASRHDSVLSTISEDSSMEEQTAQSKISITR